MLRFERAQFVGAVRLFAVFMLTLPAVAQDHSSPVETRTDASRPENVLEKSHTLSIEAVDGQSRLGTIVLQVFRSSPRQAGITGGFTVTDEPADPGPGVPTLADAAKLVGADHFNGSRQFSSTRWAR